MRKVAKKSRQQKTQKCRAGKLRKHAIFGNNKSTDLHTHDASAFSSGRVHSATRAPRWPSWACAPSWRVTRAAASPCIPRAAAWCQCVPMHPGVSLAQHDFGVLELHYGSNIRGENENPAIEPQPAGAPGGGAASARETGRERDSHTNTRSRQAGRQASL